MNRTLILVSNNLFSQLKTVIEQLSDENYTQPLSLLSENSLAKHIRHILELYEEMLNGIKAGVISYDARKRNLELETDRNYAMQFLDKLSFDIKQLQTDNSIEVLATFDAETIRLDTTIQRELAYNIEHAIHHMAILQIAIKHLFPHIQLPEQFGIAYSTQAYLKQNVHA